MSEYIIELPNGGAADECIRLRGYEKSLYGYELREPIVRCRDCKEFAFGNDEYATADWCDYWNAYVESPDGFCAWAERREL